MPEPTFDHERRDVDRLSIDYVAFSFQVARTLQGVNRQARDPWLRAAQSIPLNVAEGNKASGTDAEKERFPFVGPTKLAPALPLAPLHSHRR